MEREGHQKTRRSHNGFSFLIFITDKFAKLFIVYILYSSSIDKYYVGYTNDFERRFAEHNRKKGKYTDGGIPWLLVHQEEYAMKSDAMKREEFIKLQKSRQYILSLLSN